MIRLWMYGIILCIGSALVTWHQTQYFVANFGPGKNEIKQQRSSSSSVRIFPPAHVENERVWKEQSLSEPEYSESRSADTISDEPNNAALEGADDDDTVAQHGEENTGDILVGGLAEFHEPIDGTIQSISLLGERNSGTRWIYGYVIVMLCVCVFGFVVIAGQYL